MSRHLHHSFKNASEGIWIAFKEERNLKLHFIAAFLTILLGFLFSISYFEWLILTLSIGLVISLELTNTAIEEIVNSFTDNVHPAAKKAKDVAAGAVLTTSIMAAIIGLLIFLPHLQNLLI